MVHLGVQHPFGQGFLQIVEQTIRIESRLGVGAGQQLVEKGIRNTRFFASRHGRAPLLPSCPTPHEIPDSPSQASSATDFQRASAYSNNCETCWIDATGLPSPRNASVCRFTGFAVPPTNCSSQPAG